MVWRGLLSYVIIYYKRLKYQILTYLTDPHQSITVPLVFIMLKIDQVVDDDMQVFIVDVC